MSDFGSKIIRGERTNDEDWNQYLVEAHRQAPSMTPAAFAPYRTNSGLTSYELLADTVVRAHPHPRNVLDLACGDGYLIQFLLSRLGSAGNVIGIDMSEGELEIAQKNYSHHPQVQLHQSRAQSLPLSNDSVDAIVCHMAFMLMLPVEPVVSEIHRVLKSGGRFSAVIGNARGKSGFFSEVQKLTAQFIGSRYPEVRESRSGDSRVQSEVGLKELFSSSHGFAEIIEIHDFSLLIETGPQGVWDLMKDMYFVSMLPSSDKRELESELKNFTISKASSNEKIEFEFQMRLFTVAKK